MIDYSKIIERHYADRVASENGNTYSGIVWIGEPVPQAEVDALWPEIEAELRAKRVDRERRAAYERDTDPLFMKALEQDALGNSEVAKQLRADAIAKKQAIRERIQ